MTVLPEWIIKYDEMNSCCTNISDYKKLYEALTIAIEALEECKGYYRAKIGPSESPAEEALTRIAALGGKE